MDEYYSLGHMGTARDNVTRPEWPYVYALQYHTQHDLDRRAKGITSPDSVFYFRRVEDRDAYRSIWSQVGAIGWKEWTVSES